MAAAQLFAARAVRSVALAGGQTPRRAYKLLAQPPLCAEIAWGQLCVFWGDERCVPPDDSRSNERLAREALLDHVPIPESHIHPMRCSGNHAQAAAAYEEELRATFAGKDACATFDLVLLGLGDDGHTASLFPGSPALREETRWVAATESPDGLPRVTLTAPFINRAALVAFLVSGAAKAPALLAVLHGPRDPQRRPAQLICPIAGELLWLVDAAAAQLLE
ncbi:MAG TPA: 6-phosphogluconolactonase [Anaerolineae bacterium]|nr:6-phosphogluconolactonase [Anaerolineae bacterium]